MCDPYGIKLSHIFETPGISNENLVFQSKYVVFPSITLDFDRNTGIRIRNFEILGFSHLEFEILVISSEIPSTSKKV